MKAGKSKPGRPRASVDGGYVRRTVSLPSDLDDRIARFLKENPGMTMSNFITQAVERELDYRPKRKK